MAYIEYIQRALCLKVCCCPQIPSNWFKFLCEICCSRPWFVPMLMHCFNVCVSHKVCRCEEKAPGTSRYHSNSNLIVRHTLSCPAGYSLQCRDIIIAPTQWKAMAYNLKLCRFASSRPLILMPPVKFLGVKHILRQVRNAKNFLVELHHQHDSLQFHYGDFKTEFIDVGLHVTHYLQM